MQTVTNLNREIAEESLEIRIRGVSIFFPMINLLKIYLCFWYEKHAID